MTDCKQSTLSVGQSAFAFAVRPFNSNFIDRESSLCLLSPTETISSRRSTPTLASPGADGTGAKWVCSTHTVGPRRHQSDITARVRARYGPIAILRFIQIQTMLMRCQVLQSIVQSLEGKPWSANHDDTVFWKYEEMRELAYKARPLAEETQNLGLQARCEYWAGRACVGTDDPVAAAGHLKRARMLDVSDHPFSKVERQVLSLTHNERLHLDALIQSVIQRIEATDNDAPICTLEQKHMVQQLTTPSPSELASKKLTAREQLYVKYGKEMRPKSPTSTSNTHFQTLNHELQGRTCAMPSFQSESSVNFSQLNSIHECRRNKEDKAMGPLAGKIVDGHWASWSPIECKEV